MKLKHGESEKFRPFLEHFAPGHYAEEIQEELKKRFKAELSVEQIRSMLLRMGLKTGTRGQIRKDHAKQTMFFSDMVEFVKLHQYDYDNDRMLEELQKAFPHRVITRAALIRFRRKHNLVYRVCTQEMLEFMKENKFLPRQELADRVNEKFGRDISRHRMCALMSYYGLSTDLRKDTSKRRSKHQIGDLRMRHGHKGTMTYTEIMVGEKQWMPYQRYLYEQYHNVKLDKDMNIVFVDGDRKNFSKENLVAVPVKYMALLSYKGVWTTTRNKENLDLGITLAKLNMRLIELKKKQKELKK